MYVRASVDAPIRKENLKTSIRIAIVVSHPIQYFAPWYRAVAALPGVTLKVFFCCGWGAEAYYDRAFGTEIKWDIPLLDGYEWEILESPKEIKAQTFWEVDNPNVGNALREFSPDVVLIQGYSQRTIWRTVTWCNRNQVPVMLHSDSNASAKPAWWKRTAKAILVKYFYSHLDGAFSCGDNNRAYHRHYGIPAERMFVGTMPIDCGALRTAAGDVAIARNEIRRLHGIPEDAFVVVFAGKLIPLKCPSHLVEAIYRCAQQGLKVWGLLVGEGSERKALEAFIVEHAMNNVTLAGFVNQSLIGKYYAASDAVALMSWCEAHPLTVPEGGSFGCPAILSDEVGCIGPTDSARFGENALVYPWSHIDTLTNCIALLHGDKVLYSAMSKAAREIAELQDVSVAAQQLTEAAIRLKKMGCRQ